MSEIDRELALQAWLAVPRKVLDAHDGWPLVFLGREDGEDVVGIGYRDPRSWGLLIEAIEALPGVGAVHLGIYSRNVRLAKVAAGRPFAHWVQKQGACYGEALARLLVELVEREGAE